MGELKYTFTEVRRGQGKTVVVATLYEAGHEDMPLTTRLLEFAGELTDARLNAATLRWMSRQSPRRVPIERVHGDKGACDGNGTLCQRDTGVH